MAKPGLNSVTNMTLSMADSRADSAAVDSIATSAATNRQKGLLASAMCSEAAFVDTLRNAERLKSASLSMAVLPAGRSATNQAAVLYHSRRLAIHALLLPFHLTLCTCCFLCP